jgi:glycerol uptake facilitator protein
LITLNSWPRRVYAEAFRAFEATEGIRRGLMLDGNLVGRAAGGAGVFCTFPAFGVTWRNLLSEILGTAVLMVGVRALTDHRNAGPRSDLQPLLIGFLVWSIGLSLGGLTGYAINPARDLGPRLAAAVLGWGTAVFQSHNMYFWIPIVGPLVGGVLGALLYDLAIRPDLPHANEPVEVRS